MSDVGAFPFFWWLTNNAYYKQTLLSSRPKITATTKINA